MKLIIMCTEFEMIVLRSTQWRLLASFVILITSYQVAAQDGQVKSSSLGHDFYIGFMQSFSEEASLRLTVGTSASIASFTVEGGNGILFEQLSASASAPTVVDIPAEYFVVGSGFSERNKGIRIYSSDKPIFVIAENFDVDIQTHYSTFLAYPPFDSGSSYEYFLTSLRDGLFNSQFLLVGCKDNTTITILPSQDVQIPHDPQDSSSETVTIEVTNSHSFILNEFQTLLISTSDDLTGTKIVSNKPLTVVSGHECASLSVQTNCDPLAFQIPPMATWGTRFLLAPFSGQSAPQKFRLVSSGQTSVEYYCNNEMESAIIDSRFDLITNQYCSLESQSPILVVQIAVSVTEDGLRDSTIALVSPVDQYVSESKFIVLTDTHFPISRISVTVPTPDPNPEQFDSSSILLDGTPLVCEWEEIIFESSIVGYGCSHIVSTSGEPDYHTVSHNSSGLISVLVYGFGADNLNLTLGYAYLAGQSYTQAGNDALFIPFLDLNDFPGVQELDRVADSSSPPIFLPTGFLFGEEVVSTAYVNENGVISFKRPWAYSLPEIFPTSNMDNNFAVAVFWSDNDIRREGAVRYMAYSINDMNNTQGAELMNILNKFVQQSLGDGADLFLGQWLLVAHWDHVHPSPHGEDNRRGIPEDILNQTNNYQSIIVTDFIDTYVFNSYDIQWSVVGTGRSAVVGFTAGGNFFDNHPLSGTPAIGCAVNGQSCFAESNTKSAQNRSVNNLLSLPSDPRLRALVQPCQRTFVRDGNTINRQKPEDLRDMLEPCPHVESKAKFDCGRFKPQSGMPACFVGTKTVNSNGVSILPQCCYNKDGSLITSPNSGSVGSLLVIGSDDSQFRQDCCAIPGHPEYCKLFFDRRPIISGTKYQPLEVGSGLGDPHYRTFDNFHYNFQGQGEFTLLELYQAGETDPVFSIQGHLGYPADWKDRGVTGHLGLAFGDPNFAFHLGESGGFRVFQTKPIQSEITNTLSGVPHVIDDRISLTRAGNELILCHYDSGVRVSGLVHPLGSLEYYIDFRVHVPYSYKNQSGALLGNFDGNTNVELFTRSGTKITNLESMNLYRNMLSWNISGDPDNFLYLNNSGQRNKQEEDFEPKFIDNLNVTDEQRAFCNDNMECIFDLVVTGQEDIAKNSMEFDAETSTVQEDLVNVPPVITTFEVFTVGLGAMQQLAILVTDANDDDFNLTFSGGIVEASSILEAETPGQYNFSIQVSDSSQLDSLQPLVFVATDGRGASSELVQMVQVCACINGGECTPDGILGIDSTVILTCLCPDAYDGQFCEDDRDGCSDVQCFEGTVCDDIQAPGSGAVCSECPPGFTGDSHKCYDIDECTQNNGSCDQICVNVDGSYFCDCEVGYQLVNGSCQDINECEGFNECEHLCDNTDGSFTCSCNPGFTLATGGKHCIVNPEVSCNLDCGNGQCFLVQGVGQCACDFGYVVDGSGVCLIDRDECGEGACSQECLNLPGGFECFCSNGFEVLVGGTICADIDECLDTAFNGDNLCVDVPNSHCINTEGSYECTCVPGYSLLDGSCQRNVCFSLEELEGEIIGYSTDSTLDGNYVVGTVAVYSCGQHYALRGESSRLCGGDRAWSKPAPTCDLVMCEELSAILNGAVAFHDDMKAPYDGLTKATYSCGLGYILSGGDQVRICEGVLVDGELVGQWTGSAPTCKIPGCPPLPVAANSIIEYTLNGDDPDSYPTNTYAIYICLPGFGYSAGSVFRMCLNDESWGGTEPTCRSIGIGCEDIPDPANGNIQFNGDQTAPFNAGTTAIYECNQGYILDGDESERLCRQQNLFYDWTETAPICVSITCPALVSPDNGDVAYNNDADSSREYAFSTIAIFSCVDGFGIVGTATSSCVLDDSGTEIFKPFPPTCEPIFCPLLDDLRNGEISYEFAANDEFAANEDLPYGTVASYSCTAGHILVGGETRKCTGGSIFTLGYFDGIEPVCQEITCPELVVPENGYTAFSTDLDAPYDLGVTATYSCADGFSMENGDSERTCGYDGGSTVGQWSGDAPVCVGVCELLDVPPYGSIGYSMPADKNNDYLAGTVATFQCEEGFEVFGHTMRKCQNNMTWSESSPSCLVACPGLPNIETGEIEYTTRANTDGNYRSGTFATYSCEENFKIAGVDTAVRMCEPDMEWSGATPTCEPIMCPDLPDPGDGDIVFMNDTTAPFHLGTHAMYKCDEGFVPVGGDAIRVCLNVGQDEGQWDGTVPSCESVQCLKLHVSATAEIIYESVDSNYPFGTEAFYKCADGFRLEAGDKLRVCEMNGLNTTGTWSGVEPICGRIMPRCPDIDNPDNGRIDFAPDSMAPFDNGTIATYDCDLGYQSEGGDRVRVCEENGFSEIGAWRGTAPVCAAVVTCPTLVLPNNGSIVYSVDTVRIGYGVTATYSCDVEGLGLSKGDTVRTCAPDGDGDDIGQWTGYAPSCEKIQCEDIGDPFFGQIQFSKDRVAPFDYGTTATYTCQSPLVLDNSSENVRVCIGDGSSADGEWTGSDLICI